jgi:non-specific serine/threonine protein kinase
MEGFSVDDSTQTEALQVEALTRRERDVLLLLAENRSNRAIAEALTIEPDSVKWYTKQIYGKLGVHDRQQAVARARQLGLIGGEARPGISLPCNLPVSLTTFIGRQRDVEQVMKMLANPAYRLITLTGAGGVGKTRLALRVAEITCAANEKAVRLVELAAVSNPAVVIETVLSAFGLRVEQGLTPLNVLQNHLRAKKLLLVLDNCEHLVDACARLAESLLKTCPNLKILVTSREALGVPGETPYCVPSLSIPGDGISPDHYESLLDYEAAALFVERASQALPGFELLPGYTEAIVRICQLLDGIPLAMELAAARVNVLSVEQIANRLEESFSLLTGGSRTSLPRHQTMRATLDWSYHLLSAIERTVLQRLAVFAGGWTLDMAENACSAQDGDNFDVLDVLAQLVNKSLVIVGGIPGLAIRYRLLETIRQYAGEKLAESGDELAARNRHLQFFLQWAEAGEPKLHGHGQMEWMDRLEIERDNVRAALEWAAGKDAASGLRLASAVWWFWCARGPLGEGLDCFDKLLAERSDVPGSIRARALSDAGWLAFFFGDRRRAVELSNASLALYTALGDRWGTAFPTCTLGVCAYYELDYVRARPLYEASAALYREAGIKWGLRHAIAGVGYTKEALGDLKQAREHYQESLALSREIGDKEGIAWALYLLGLLDKRQNFPDRALKYLEEALAVAREVNSKIMTSWALKPMAELMLGRNDEAEVERLLGEALRLYREMGMQAHLADALFCLGIIACRRQNFRQAAACFAEGLALAVEINDHVCFARNLMGIASLAGVCEQLEKAARLAGVADRLNSLLPPAATLWPEFRLEYDTRIAAARLALGEVRFAALYAEGAAMTEEQALAYALDEASE